MTSKIKKVREQPLLQVPPEETDPLAVKRSDQRAISEQLRQYREKGEAYFLREMLYHMHALNLAVEITDQDRKIMHDDLANDRAEGEGLDLVEGTHQMRQMGLNAPLSHEDWKMIARSLRESRRQGDVGDGGDILSFHWHMKRLGRKPDIIGGDRKSIMDDFQTLREFEDGMFIAIYHLRMRELDMGVEVTDRDKRAIFARLEWARGEKRGDQIAEMLLILRGLFPMEAAPARQPLPPLKEFKEK